MKARRHDLVVTRWGARFLGQNLPCAVGRGGIGDKSGEGDGVTPHGTWRLMQVFVRPDRTVFEGDHLISPRDAWSDDPHDPNYNHHVVGADYKFSHESLRRADRLYDLVGITDFNWPISVPGAGSAIFLHVWRKPRHPTEGCIAFDRRDLIWILTNWQRNSRIVVTR